MDNTEKNELEKMVLAPYIQKATALRGKYRYVGGNQFRHALGTFAILLDYHYMDPVLLKASFIHDLFEDTKCSTAEDIMCIDKDGPDVYKLVIEVTRTKDETKDEFLERILMFGSTNAKILKCADRISNLTDLHTDIFEKEFIKKYIDETKRWVIPMAEQVNKDMLFELKDILHRRERHFKIPTHIWPLTRKDKED
jgi:GTP pyrophosphokinase